MNGDSIKYDGATKALVEQHTTPLKVKKNGKTKDHPLYDKEFAERIKELEENDMMFIYTDDESLLSENQLGLVEGKGDDHTFYIIVPNHKGTNKEKKELLAGGRGAILAEETFHAIHIARGDLLPAGKKFTTGRIKTGGSEILAKSWAAERKKMVILETLQYYEGFKVKTMMGLINSYDGDINKIVQLLQDGKQETIWSMNGSSSKILFYQPSYNLW